MRLPRSSGTPKPVLGSGLHFIGRRRPRPHATRTTTLQMPWRHCMTRWPATSCAKPTELAASRSLVHDAPCPAPIGSGEPSHHKAETNVVSNRELIPAEHGQPVGHDFQLACIVWVCRHVHVPDQDVRCHPASSLSAHPSSSALHSKPSPSQHPSPGASCSVVATGIVWTATADALGEWETKSLEVPNKCGSIRVFSTFVGHRERDKTLTTPSPGHIKDHELKAKGRRLKSAHVLRASQVKSLHRGSLPAGAIPPGRPRCQWRSRSKGKCMFSRMGGRREQTSPTNRT